MADVTTKVSSRNVQCDPDKGAKSARLGGPPFTGHKAKAEPDRVKKEFQAAGYEPFDATGYYESLAELDENSKSMLHVNHFGLAVVGWISSPPPFVVTSDKRFAVPEGLFVCCLEKKHKTSRGYRLWRVNVHDSVHTMDPTAVISPMKPWDLDKVLKDRKYPFNGGVYLGFLHCVNDQIILDFDKPGVPSVTYRRVNRSARVSSRTTKNQPEALKMVLLARQQNPIPLSYYDIEKPCGAQWKETLNRFAPDGPISQRIKKYMAEERANRGATRMTNREAISNLLDFPWDQSPPLPQAPYLNLLLLQQVMQLDSGRVGLTIEAPPLDFRMPENPELDPNGIPTNMQHGPPETRSVLEWLSYISVYEKMTLGKFADVPRNFYKVMACATIYRYTLKFTTTASATPPWWLSAAVGGFDVTISVAAAERNLDGSPKEFKDLDGEATLGGVFCEVKGGLGDPPELPKAIEIFDSERYSAADHFSGASFSVVGIEAAVSTSVGVAAPVYKAGWKITIIGGKTQLLEIRLKGKSVVLRGVFDDARIVPTWDNIKEEKKHKLDYDKLGKMRPGATIGDLVAPSRPKGIKDVKDIHKWVQAGISLGMGAFYPKGTLPVWKHAAPIIKDETVLAPSDARAVAAQFNVKEYALTRMDNGWSARFLLEMVLATELALFDGFPKVEVRGFASPEGGFQFNGELSQSRANTILQAILDVKQVPQELCSAVGVGEEAAYQAGLADPEMEQGRRVQKPGMSDQWPEWRRAEIHIRGTPAIKIATVSASDEKNP